MAGVEWQSGAVIFIHGDSLAVRNMPYIVSSRMFYVIQHDMQIL